MNVGLETVEAVRRFSATALENRLEARTMSARRRSPPSQKALAPPDWPKADRETWQTAQETAGALDDGGAAKRINPHPFRSCLATSTAIYHGAEIGLAMTVLEHTSSEVFERYYNQAKMIDAVKAYQEILLANPQG